MDDFTDFALIGHILSVSLLTALLSKGILARDFPKTRPLSRAPARFLRNLFPICHPPRHYPPWHNL